MKIKKKVGSRLIDNRLRRWKSLLHGTRDVNKTKWFGQKSVIAMLALLVLTFCAGLIAGQSGFIPVFATAFSQAASDVEWAVEQGFLQQEVTTESFITQAQFLQMVMKRFGESQTGLQVPDGAENHWAAGIYALASGKGVIDCSCVIKPDGEITAAEAAKFVMLAINRKANQHVVDMEEVSRWVKLKEDDIVTFADAATLLRKMDEVYREHGLIPLGEDEQNEKVS